MGRAVKNSLEIVTKQVRLEGGFERGGRIRVAECLRQIVPERWASIKKRSFICGCGLSINASLNYIRPDFLRRDGLQSGVPYHSVMETTNQCCLQQNALFLIKAGKMRQITD